MRCVLSGGLHAGEHVERTLRLAHQAQGLSAAFDGPFQRGLRLLYEAKAGLPLLGGGDEEGDLIGLERVRRLQVLDQGLGGVVSTGEVFGAVGRRIREGAAEGVDKLVIDGGRKLRGDALVVQDDGVGHGSHYSR